MLAICQSFAEMWRMRETNSKNSAFYNAQYFEEANNVDGIYFSPVYESTGNVGNSSGPRECVSCHHHLPASKLHFALLAPRKDHHHQHHNHCHENINHDDGDYLARRQVVYSASSNSGLVPMTIEANGFCSSPHLTVIIIMAIMI